MINIFELCPICNNEVEIKDIFEVQECPSCQNEIKPCSICNDMKCQKCPLESVALNSYDESYEFEKKWLKRIVNRIYKMDLEEFLGEYTYDDTESIKEMYKDYEITLEQAKEMGNYKFELDYDLNDLRQGIARNSLDLLGECPAELSLGELSIKLCIHGEMDLDICYFIYVKDPQYGDDFWEGYGYTNTIFNIKQLECIEQFMFNELIGFAKNRDLYWSRFNK